MIPLIPGYCFARVKENVKKEKDQSILPIYHLENTTPADTLRVQTSFYNGKCRLQRLYFLRRYKIKTPQHMINHTLPVYDR